MSHITKNFTTGELTRSRTATKLGMDNSIPDTLMVNARALCNRLEEVRELVKGPIVISSGFRSPKLNALIGGSRVSAHCHALAADIHTPKMNCRQLALLIAKSNIKFDQVIYEGSWVHFGLAKPRRNSRQQLLTAIFKPGEKTRYVNGII